jgi:hypothetical protein
MLAGNEIRGSLIQKPVADGNNSGATAKKPSMLPGCPDDDRITNASMTKSAAEPPSLSLLSSGGNGAVLQSPYTTDNDASLSLSLLTIASNPHVIVPPPTVNQLPQQTASVTLRSADNIEKQRTGRQATQT